MNLHDLQEKFAKKTEKQKDQNLIEKISADKDSPNRVSNNRIKLKKKILALVCSLAFVATITLTAAYLMSNNRLVSQASCDEEAAKLKELIPLMEDKELYLTKPYATSDFVNPWLFTDYTPEQIDEYVKMLKKAGYKNIILQNIATLSGGAKNDVKITCAWYETSLVNDPENLEIYNPTLLKNLIDALTNNDMGIYIGIALSNDWLNNSFTNNAWKYSNAVLINSIINEVYTNYGNYSCFKGWYLGYDIYPNTQNHEQHWVELLNYSLNYITSIESSGQSHPVLIAPYFNDEYILKNNDVYAFWKNILQNTNFRTGDIICLQDGLGTSKQSAEQIYDYIQQTQKAINSNETKLDFWLSVENFRDINTAAKPADVVKYRVQLDICSKLATNLASYSYSHYYNPRRVDPSFNEEYLAYFTDIATGVKTSKNNSKNNNETAANKQTNSRNFNAATTSGISLEFENNNIPAPKGGYVHKDKNGDCAPIPPGFGVSSYAYTINDGLVIMDKNYNQYVWIPVKNGIQPNGYTYNENDTQSIYYSRYIQNGVHPANVTNDTLPLGVSADTTQIEKYHGFYIGRFESSYNYNLGQPTCSVKYTKSCNSELSFNWKYSNSNTFTGYTWNNVNYTDAKNIAENMCKKYNYNPTVKTGLINGTQWDTTMRFIENSYPTNNPARTSQKWGNFTDATAPANTLNYQVGILKPSGSNKNWSVKNIYDLAGNLSEWTSEIVDGKNITRSTSFNQPSASNGASYASPIANDEYTNVGFRVVLYID